MRLSFDSIEEVKEFVKGLKGTRGGKGGGDDEAAGSAPAPLQPSPGTGFLGAPAGTGFAPPGLGAGPQGGAFPAPGVTGLAPELQALVQRIVTRIDSTIASGQPAEAVLQWFRGQCGPEAAQYTMDQIKMVALPKVGQPVLENIAKLINA